MQFTNCIRCATACMRFNPENFTTDNYKLSHNYLRPTPSYSQLKVCVNKQTV